MAYSKVLRNAIAGTEYTQKEIAEKCTEMGIKMNKSQINRLVNGTAKPSNIEISKVLAKICGIDERLLILEDYFDKAPKEIVEVFYTFKYLIFLATNSAFENHIPKNALETLKEEIEKQPLSDFVINLLDNGKVHINNHMHGIKIISEDNQMVLNTGIIGFNVKDDAMSPLLPKGSKVTLESMNNYSNGDIVLLKLNNNEDCLIRRMFDFGSHMILIADNKKFEQKTVKKKDITILGKVNNLITKVQ